MNLFRHFQHELLRTVENLVSEGRLPRDLDIRRVAVEPPRDPSHGDITTNAAMILARPAQMKPRELATLLAEQLLSVESVETAEVAGPGFINLRLSHAFWHERLAEILAAGVAYGDSNMGAGHPVNVEYVSANPTGPLHVGHGRGAVCLRNRHVRHGAVLLSRR